jgi:bifunctional UDP-N-acetylglucosamine pyrophosphorylase / glucosamine-1-phosphate N-acetyltransferase
LGSGLPPESPDTVVVTSADISLLDADILAGLVATHNSPSAAVTC